MTENIKSLKLRTVSLCLPQYESQLPAGLEHMDPEILVEFQENYHGQREIEDHSRYHVGEWRYNLQLLKQLNTLRLGFRCGGGRTHGTMFGQGVRIDSLLVRGNNQGNRCIFPRLNSLTL